MTSKAREKFGRYLAEVWIPGDTDSISLQLINAGHARPYDGGPRSPTA